MMPRKETHGVADTPRSDRDTAGAQDTGLEDNGVINRGSSFDVKFGDSNINISGGGSLNSGNRASCNTGLIKDEIKRLPSELAL